MSHEEFDNLVEPLRNSTKEQVLFETVHQRKDGTQYPVEVYLQLIQFGNEKLFAGIIIDISERKRTESILKSERERLAGIIEGTNVGTWEWHVQTGKWTLMNAGRRSLLFSGECNHTIDFDGFLSERDDFKDLISYTSMKLEHLKSESRKNINPAIVWVLAREMKTF